MFRYKVMKLQISKSDQILCSHKPSCQVTYNNCCNEIILLYRHSKAIEIYVNSRLTLTTQLRAHNKVSTCIANYVIY